MYFAFADREQLGYDESVRFFGRNEDGHRVWDYKLGDRTYRTIR